MEMGNIWPVWFRNMLGAEEVHCTGKALYSNNQTCSTHTSQTSCGGDAQDPRRLQLDRPEPTVIRHMP